MSVQKQDWSPERGESDAKRHRDLVKENVRKRAIDVISDTPIVGKSGKVKVRISGKKSYSIRHGQHENAPGGVGQGEGKVNDIIGKSPLPDEGEGGPGDEPGEWTMETEIELAEILEWLVEDLGLPKLKKRETSETAVRKTWKPSGVKRVGVPPRLKKKLTIKQAIKRYAGIVLAFKELLKDALGAEPTLPDYVYVWAYGRAEFDRDKTVEILKQITRGEIQPPSDEEPINLDDNDLRFKKFEEEVEYESNAVFFAIMDVSGSMDTEKKLMARSFYWWAYNFLRMRYENVKIIFVAHQTEAKVVKEEEFFHMFESGGTYSYTGFELVKNLVRTDFPPDKWNIYTMYFSDGEDFDPERTTEVVKALLPICNAMGYAEVGESGELLKRFIPALELQSAKIDDLDYYRYETEEQYLMGAEIMEREEIWPLLKAFFYKSEEVDK